VNDPSTPSLAVYLWTALGIGGALLFYGRFYVQWLASEFKKRSVMPTVFWYMSSCGSVMLLAYAVWERAPLGALGQNFNLVVYARNLVHIWREKGHLSKRASLLVHVAVFSVVFAGVGFVVLTWYWEYEANRVKPPEEARVTWLWLAVGLVGQALFALRFVIQWIATERQKKSVVPTSFWYISVAAAALQCGTFVQRQEWVFAAGMIATILIYARNLWFIHTHDEGTVTVTLKG